MARIVDDELGGLRTKTWADGWPRGAHHENENAVTFSAGADGATSITNDSGCPADPFGPGAGLTVPGSVSFTIDPVARRISLDGGLVDGSGTIAADGTFAIHSGTDRWGFKRATGRVAAGGFVIVDTVETMECHTNYAGDVVHGAERANAAIGAADPNYR
jgi:hypothetical protein